MADTPGVQSPVGEQGAIGEKVPVLADAAEHLCVSCHLCCSGALFGKLVITEDERDAMGPGVETFLEGQTLCMRLGCNFLGSNGGCQAYERRPSGCGQYKCSLLKKLEAGEVDHRTAMDRVAIVRMLATNCLDAAHDALTDDYWNDKLMRTAIQAYLRTQIAQKAGIDLPAEKLDRVEMAWCRYSHYVSAHFVDHVDPDDFRTSLILPGGPFDRSNNGVAANG
jgi:Fe-S-cluster containining protein